MEKAGRFTRSDQNDRPLLAPFNDFNMSARPEINLDTEILIKDAFETDPNKGIELLFRHYYRTLCSHAVRYVNSKEIAEDIVSDIFYKFHSEQTFFEVKTSFRAYLFASVRNRSFDYVRAEFKRNTSIQYADYVAIQADEQPDQLIQFEDLWRDLENAVNSLPLKRRRIYVMHRFDGKKYQEIADELNLSVRTVQGQMFQALHQVRKIIREKWFFIFLIFIE